MQRLRAASVLLLGALLGQCDSAKQPLPTRFHVRSPYARDGHWTKSNFHAHTTHSDGALSGEEMVRVYESAGYGVLCLSDHNQFGDQDGGILAQFQDDSLLHDWNNDGTVHPDHVFGSGVEAYVRDWRQPPPAWTRDRWAQPRLAPGEGQIVLLPGAELTHGGHHIGLIGVPPGWIEPPQGGLGSLGRTRAAGGFVYLAHPGELNDNPDALLRTLDLKAFDGIEIINGLWLSKSGPADATPLWDKLLARGLPLWGLANDDAHTWVGAEEAPPLTAFNMVLSQDPSPQGFLAALHAGSFYASTGLLFEDLDLRGDSLCVSAPGAERLRFIGRAGSALAEVFASQAVYVIGGLEGYVRVQADAPPDSGMSWSRSAWSQPFFINLSRP